MIDVITAEQHAEKFLQQVVVLVGGLGAAVNRHGVGAVALVNFHHSISRIIESLVPRNFAPLITIESLGARAGRLRGFSNEWRGHAVLVVDKVVAEAAFNAQISVIDHRVKRRGDFVDVVVLDVQLELTSHAAIRAGGRDNAVGGDHGDFLRRLLPALVAWIISFKPNPCSSSASRLGLSAPVGQTPTHWPQKTQVVSGMGLSKKVPMPVSKPRPLKLIA